ncbi:GntR family transcriptional regulator [Lentibacillus salicampi]|uniref:GntR family transcriptional regulator n=1 Tax=Lentibacillus salicampi TaxID=175306 RepID=A0A4Y9A963_9BACI|nr:GntR family transcriptional regulator [Lentibacillus salicampi]TFJ91657.1 GntR family transcriptional regulator [Lentibacillus salicampi]
MWNGSLPLYKQIANNIKDDIANARLSDGDAIPSEIKLAETYGVSRVTIREAIKQLVEEGILYRIQGSGTYISHEKIEHDILKLQGFTEEMSSLDNNPSNEILEFQLMTPPEDARDQLKIGAEKKVYYVKRLRLADFEPLILEESYLPVELFPDLSIDVMERSKYEYISSKGYNIDRRYGELIPKMPSNEMLHHFNINTGDPLLFMQAFSTFSDGTVFEYSKIYFHPHKYSFKVVSSR